MSGEATTSRAVSGLSCPWSCLTGLRSGLPLSRRQRRTNLSAPPEAIRLWLSSQATALISESVRARAIDLPLGISHTRSVLSEDAERRRVLSGENFRERTGPLWAENFFVNLPLASSQILMRPSSPPVASHLPSGLAASASTSLRATEANWNFFSSFERCQILTSR